MLILCVGPDTFRAQQKAHELERVFKEKYDPSGSSVERVEYGKNGIQQVIERASTASLFAPRRFLLGRDLLSECPKALLSPFVRALAGDQDQTIVVSVESEAPTASTLKPFEPSIKVVRYDFSALTGAAFRQWLQQIAEPFSQLPPSAVAKIAEASDGDSWLAWTELMKAAAGSATSMNPSVAAASAFDLADRMLAGTADARAWMQDEERAGEMLNIILQQSRAALRVRDGATEGLHPFVVKKLQRLRPKEVEQTLAAALATLLSQRSGLGAEEECAPLL